jgi:tetratricopeptide (TPR) repeat protein
MTYSADQLATLSKLSSDMIQELAQLSLLDERGGRFSFRDLASARQIAKLLADGVRLSEIIRAVSQIRKWLPEVGLANVRLHTGAHYSLEVEQPGGRTDQNGQFVLAVNSSQNNPDDLFEQAQAAEDAGDTAEAERLYRILVKTDPTDASAPFNLGNLLRASARNVEAEAALRTAARVDPTFADAWYNLGDLLDEQGRSEAAIECLRSAPCRARLRRYNVQSRADAATNKPIRRGCRLLATLSCQRWAIGMGSTGAPINEIL